ncbi:MAG: hypothetical protein CR997_02330 [Acidobacteria bacterium]|nr:MAG: hypothetical protein CR997_02330 [Acidobacteriota bacterium]
MKKNIIPILLVVSGLLIYLYRLYDYNKHLAENKLFKTEEGGIQLQGAVFKKQVMEKFSDRLDGALLNLIIFCDLDYICPGYLDEAKYWVEPLNTHSSTFFNVHIFIPNDVSPETLDEFKNTYLIDSSNIVLYDPSSPISVFRSFGIFKVLNSQLNGIEFIEKTSTTKQEYEKFYSTLLMKIDSFKHYMD